MTLPDERTRAILAARRLLADLATGEEKRVPRATRDRARACLRHFPLPCEVEWIAEAADKYLDAPTARADIKAHGPDGLAP